MVTMSRLILAVLALAGAVFAGSVVHQRRAAERQVFDEAQHAAAAQRAVLAAFAKTRSQTTVARGMIFETLLRSVNLDAATAQQMSAAAQQVFNFRRLLQGNKLILMRSLAGEPRAVLYRIDPDHELWIVREGDEFRANLRTVPSELRTVAIGGQIDGSLFEGVLEAGERPELAVRLAEIFAFDLDFYTDPQPGDTFRLVMEKKEYANGEPASYGRILAAEYNNAGRPYRAVLFHDADGRPGYYSADGKSLQKAFLRSPLKFAARISSHFSRARFHPILKIYRPHLGTDYAAPAGTPVQAIAAGRVVSAGWGGQGGNAVRLAHANGYETYYMHLSRILVRAGQHVEQGQRIGLVGMTGLATGPHLDFRLRQRGAFVNFERLKLPPAFPVPPGEMAAFTATRDKWMALLPSVEQIKIAVAQARSGNSAGH
jgi:murein DD-endopeptidase MepM/ murein hydrolase activator NlpD